MNKSQLVHKIYPLYKSTYKNVPSFSEGIYKIRTKYNDRVEKAFMLGSLCAVDAKALKKQYPRVALLLCYTAVESLANNLTFLEKTEGAKITDFTLISKTERNINKTKSFEKFLDIYTPHELQTKIIVRKKPSKRPESQMPFNDIVRYLYQKNRSYIIHKGIFRNIDSYCSFSDIFIDRNGEACCVVVETTNNTLIGWFYRVVKACFLNFIKS